MQNAPRTTADVVVIGGGIIGCSAAAILADRGADVVLLESTTIGAGASGRNMGAIQHPFDPVLAPLYRESVSRYQALAGSAATDFAIGAAPAGLLLLARDPDGAARQVARLSRALPELYPTLLGPDDVASLEPSLGEGLSAVRVETGYPVPPAAATEAWSDLAVERGARILVGSPARPIVTGDRVTGAVCDDGTTIAAGAVLVAAGPWTPLLVDPSGGWRAIVSTYGVTLQLRLGAAAPRHIVEEVEVDAVNRAAAATERASTVADPDADPPSLFSMASADGISTLGSTFLPAEPDPRSIEPILLRRAAEFLPAVAGAEIVARHLCARPQSVDGRPFIGAVGGVEGLYVCAGHGPWGISTGPASAAITARAILDKTPPPAELDAARPF